MNWFSRQSENNTNTTASDQLAALGSNGVSISLAELLQYQRKVNLINLAATKNQKSKMSGNYLSRSKGRGMEFDEVRHYQTGDDIRTIDWRVTARTGKTHTKLFREEIERPVLIATDLSSSMYFGSQLLFKSVQAAHIAALVAWHAKERGDRLGGLVFNEQQHLECKPRSRKQGVLHYLHQLISLDNAEKTAHDSRLAQQAFTENCLRMRQLAKPGSLVYLITDGYNISNDSIRHLAHISRHCELVICQIFDPLERNLPNVKTSTPVTLSDGEQRLSLTLGDKRIAKQYQQQAMLFQQQQNNLFSKAHARVFMLDAGVPLEQQLLAGGVQ